MSAIPCSPKTLAKLKQAYNKTGSVSAAARAAGLNWHTANKALNADPIKEAEDRAELSRELARERELLQDVAGERSFRKFLSDLVSSAVQPIQASKPPRSARGGRSATMRYPILSLNDWHFEEIVKPEAVLGLNEYSIPIACRRVCRVVNAVREWKRDIEAGGRFVIPELTVALNGDFLTGTLHGLERHTDAPNVVGPRLPVGT